MIAKFGANVANHIGNVCQLFQNFPAIFASSALVATEPKF